MASSSAPVVAALVVACLLIAVPLTESAVTCGQVVTYLTPCLSYVRNGGVIPAACCSGVKGLNAAAKTTPERQTACNCLKRAATTVAGVKNEFISGLPGKCGVDIPYPISTSVDCTKVK